MPNPIVDLERAHFIQARSTLREAHLPAWPRAEKSMRVVELEVGWVRFSTLNHRTRAEQQAVIARTGVSTLFSGDPMGHQAQSEQYKILSAQEGFAELKRDLKLRNQLEPAIVTADGVLVNGNRRAAALRSLYEEDDFQDARYVSCMVLPADATPTELVDLETELQIARDFKQEYGWINEALLIEELYQRENLDFARVASRMHRDVGDVRGLYEKLEQVHILVGLSEGTRNHIDFNDNESIFDELSKHVKNLPHDDADSVRSVYFLGALSGVPYRKLRHLRRPDAAALVRRELDMDPTLRLVLENAPAEQERGAPDPLDDALDEGIITNPLTPFLSLMASRKVTDTVPAGGESSVDVRHVLDGIQNAIAAAAEEAEEGQRDQQAQTAPFERMAKSKMELERALQALPRARAFTEFDESGFRSAAQGLSKILDEYLASQ